nr:MAG TPA: IreB regulatory phosphoprotein [Caudoviricetes sp.]
MCYTAAGLWKGIMCRSNLFAYILHGDPSYGE